MNNDEKPTPKKPEKYAQRKVFDVMAPGKAPASSNSRNVISSHKKQVKEDMFVASPNSRMAKDNPNDDHDLMSPSKKVSINPVSDDLKAVSKSNAAAEETAPLVEIGTGASAPEEKGPEFEAPALTPAAWAEDKPAESTQEASTAPLIGQTAVGPQTETPKDVSEAAPAEEQLTPEQVATNKAMENPPTVETPKEILDEVAAAQENGTSNDDVLAGTHAPSLDQTVVSHHKHHTKIWEWVLIFALIVLVALVALNFLLDAEVLTTDVDVPHTNLIK